MSNEKLRSKIRAVVLKAADDLEADKSPVTGDSLKTVNDIFIGEWGRNPLNPINPLIQKRGADT